MTNISTQELISHLYNESSDEQQLAIYDALSESPELLDEMHSLAHTKTLLSGKMLSPSNTSIKIILQHSYKTEDIHHLG